MKRSMHELRSSITSKLCSSLWQHLSGKSCDHRKPFIVSVTFAPSCMDRSHLWGVPNAAQMLSFVKFSPKKSKGEDNIGQVLRACNPKKSTKHGLRKKTVFGKTIMQCQQILGDSVCIGHTKRYITVDG